MDIIEAVENHIRDYKELKERHAVLLKNYETAERWLAVAIGKAGGKIYLEENETFKQFQVGRGVAFGARECHYFDYYNAVGYREYGVADSCKEVRS